MSAATCGLDCPALLSLELRQLGGALAPGRERAGAVDSIDAGFAMFAVGVTPDAAAMHAVRAAVTAAQHAMAPWSTGGCYLNFAESRKSGAALFGSTAYERLRAVKGLYDPADLIRSNHPIPPSG